MLSESAPYLSRAAAGASFEAVKAVVVALRWRQVSGASPAHGCSTPVPPAASHSCKTEASRPCPQDLGQQQRLGGEVGWLGPPAAGLDGSAMADDE